MLTRTLLSFSLIAHAASVGCGKKADPAGTGSAAVTGSGSGSGSGGSAAMGSGSDGSAAGSGSGSAAPTGASTCIPKGFVGLSTFTVDDKGATYCVKDESAEVPKEQCETVAFDTGAITDAKVPAKADGGTPKTTYEVKQSAKGTELCKDAKCVALEVPKFPKPEEPYEGPPPEYFVEVSPDGKLAVVSGGIELKEALLLDATTGKVKKKLAMKGPESPCLEGAWFLGNDFIYVLGSVCAGPGGESHLYNRDGKALDIKVGEDQGINPYGSTPIDLGDGTWAIGDFGGGNVAILDPKAGAQTKIEVKQPDECPTCLSIDGTTAMTDMLAKSGDKLVTIGPTGVTVIDAKTKKIVKTHAFNACPEK